MADLKVVGMTLNISSSKAQDDVLTADSIYINPLRTEAVICYLDTENYVCAYLMFSSAHPELQKVNLRLMRELKNCNANVILVESDGDGGSMFITDHAYSHNMIAIMESFAKKFDGCTISKFNGSVEKDVAF